MRLRRLTTLTVLLALFLLTLSTSASPVLSTSSQLRYIEKAFPGHEGVVLSNQPATREQEKPDGIGFANAIARERGVIWPADPFEPEDKFTDTDDCWEYIDEICDDAGHGGAKAMSATITTHEDGCRTCSADCKQHGAVGFVTEANCGDDDEPKLVS